MHARQQNEVSTRIQIEFEYGFYKKTIGNVSPPPKVLTCRVEHNINDRQNIKAFESFYSYEKKNWIQNI